MDDLVALLPLGAITLPTAVLAIWPRGRRFAHLPLAAIALIGGALVSLQMGRFVKASSLDPVRYRCGDPFFIPLIGLIALGCTVFVAGAALTAWDSTRVVGNTILSRVLPAFLLACVVCGALGRYGPW